MVIDHSVMMKQKIDPVIQFDIKQTKDFMIYLPFSRFIQQHVVNSSCPINIPVSEDPQVNVLKVEQVIPPSSCPDIHRRLLKGMLRIQILSH